MKALIPVVLAALLALAACQITDLPVEYQAKIEAAELKAAELLAELELARAEARERADEAEVVRLDAERDRILRELEADRSSIIQEGVRSRFGWVGDVAVSLGVPGFLATWWPALAALLFQRPRRQLKRAGGKLLHGKFLGFVLDLLSVLGLKDSTAASKRAAEAAPITEPAR